MFLLVQVCRASGYFEHALFVAQAASEPEWYLDILIEDLGNYEEALAYLQGLQRENAATALQKYGKVHTSFLESLWVEAFGVYPCQSEHVQINIDNEYWRMAPQKKCF